jgi:hypothetical protein
MGNLNPEARREKITQKAFELYQKRGCQSGHELDDWLEAERLVDRETPQSASSRTTTTTAAPTPTPTPQPAPRSVPTPTPIRSGSSKVGYKRVSG